MKFLWILFCITPLSLHASLKEQRSETQLNPVSHAFLIKEGKPLCQARLMDYPELAPSFLKEHIVEGEDYASLRECSPSERDKVAQNMLEASLIDSNGMHEEPLALAPGVIALVGGVVSAALVGCIMGGVALPHTLPIIGYAGAIGIIAVPSIVWAIPFFSISVSYLSSAIICFGISEFTISFSYIKPI